MFNRYPVLLLLVPYISGLLFGPVAFVAWTIKAALSSRSASDLPASFLDARAAVKNLIPLLMAAAGLPFSSPPPIPMEEDSLVVLEGVIKDGSWYRPGFTNEWESQISARSRGFQESFRLLTPTPLPESLHVGDRIQLKGRFRKRGRGSCIETRSTLIRQTGQKDGLYLLLRPIHSLRKRLWQGLQSSLDRQSASLVGAMLLGLSGKVDGHTKETFRRTGTAHLLAISGLHVGLISIMLLALCKKVGLEEKNIFLPFLLSLLFFCFLSGGRVPVFRAYLVCVLYLCAARIHRPLDPLNPLFIACMILLIIHPRALHDLSFQLSFAGYGSILLFFKLRERLLRKKGTADVVSKTGTRKTMTRKVVMCLGISFASWLGTLPLILHYFQRFNPWTPFINLIIFPFFVAALLSGAIHLIVVSMDLHHSLITVWPCETCIALLTKMLEFCDSLPPGAMTTSPLTGYAVVMIYGVLGLALAAWCHNPLIFYRLFLFPLTWVWLHRRY